MQQQVNDQCAGKRQAEPFVYGDSRERRVHGNHETDKDTRINQRVVLFIFKYLQIFNFAM